LTFFALKKVLNQHGPRVISLQHQFHAGQNWSTGGTCLLYSMNRFTSHLPEPAAPFCCHRHGNW